MKVIQGVAPDGAGRMAVMPEVGDTLLINQGTKAYDVRTLKLRNLSTSAGFEFTVHDGEAWSPWLNPFGKGNNAMYMVVEGGSHD